MCGLAIGESVGVKRGRWIRGERSLLVPRSVEAEWLELGVGEPLDHACGWAWGA
jgi:hypothetical protein